MQIPDKTTVKCNIDDVRRQMGKKGPYLSLRLLPVDYPDETLWVNFYFSSPKAIEISQEGLDALGYKGDVADVDKMFSDLKDTLHEFYVQHDSYNGVPKYRVNVNRGNIVDEDEWAKEMRSRLKGAGVKEPDEFE